MDINIFKNKPLQKNMLICSDMIFTNANIIGGVNFNQTVNAGTDIVLGSCTSSTIEFQLENLNTLINDIAGKEITWKQGIKTNETNFKDFILASQSDLICLNGNVAYVVEKTTLKLTIWDVATKTKIKDVTIQPTLPIKSLLLVDGVLYCGHDETSYITKYTVSANDIVKDLSPILTEFQISKILYYNKYNYAFNMQGNILKEYTIQKYDLIPVDLIESTFEFIQIGIFKAEKPTKTNDTQLRVKCFDRMMKFDVVIDDWLKTIVYPISLKNALTGLCNFLGITLATSTFLNEGYIIKKNFEGSDITGRQYLKWICEIAAKYAIINEQGQLILDWYKEVDYDITNSDYYNLKVDDYLTKAIDKVQVRVEENDIGVIVGTGTNAYVIQNNPLLYAETDAEIRSTVENIYNAISTLSYYPFEITVNPNSMLKAGDIVTIKTRDWDKYIVDNLLMTVDEMTEMVDFYQSGQVFKAVIMTRKMTNGSDIYSATGNMKRALNKSLNQSIIQLRGKTNVLERTIDATISKLYDVATGDITIIKQTSESISLKVSNAESDISTLEQTATTLTSRLLTAEGNISTVTQTASNLTSRISTAEGNISTVTQTANSLTTRISDAEGNISTIKQTTDSIALAVGASKLVFDSSGLTIKDGGFKILNGTQQVFYIDSNGKLIMASEFYNTTGAYGVRIANGKIEVSAGNSAPGPNWWGNVCGNVYGVYQDYFPLGSTMQLVLEGVSGVRMKTQSGTAYLAIGTATAYLYGNININGYTYTRKKHSDIASTDYVLVSTS